MSASAALRAARAAGISLTVDGADLLLAAACEPPPDVLDSLKRHKSAIIDLLRREKGAQPTQTAATVDGHPQTLCDDEHAEREERAAIIEHDGGLPREWAELLARLNRLRPSPVNVNDREWLSYVDACHKLADGWAARMAELGWSPQAMLGWDGRGDFPYMAHNSLPWLLAVGDYTLISLDAHEAVVETRAGHQRVLRRVAERQELVWRWWDH